MERVEGRGVFALEGDRRFWIAMAVCAFARLKGFDTRFDQRADFVSDARVQRRVERLASRALRRISSEDRGVRRLGSAGKLGIGLTPPAIRMPKV